MFGSIAKICYCKQVYIIEAIQQNIMNLLDHNVRFFRIRHALFEEMLKGLHLLSRQSSPRDHDAAPFPLEEDCKSFTFCGGWAQCFMKKQVLTGQEQGKGVKGMDRF